MGKTVIIGMGNPLLTDDGVGLKVAQELRNELGDENGIEVKELYAGGIRLIDAVAGYEKAVIIDAMVTGRKSPGTICVLPDTELGTARNISSTHDINLATALEMGRMLGLEMPGEIKVFGIEAGEVERFSEELTEAVSCAVPKVVRIIADGLRQEEKGAIL